MGNWTTGEPTTEGYYWVDTTDPSGVVPGVVAPALWHDRWEIAGLEGGTPVYSYFTTPLVAPVKGGNISEATQAIRSKRT